MTDDWEAFKAGFEASAEGFNGEVFIGEEDAIREKYEQWKCEHEWGEWNEREALEDGIIPHRRCEKCGEREFGEMHDG